MSRRRREREIKVQGTDSRGIVLWRDCLKVDIRGAGNQLALGMSPLSFFSASFFPSSSESFTDEMQSWQTTAFLGEKF